MCRDTSTGESTRTIFTEGVSTYNHAHQPSSNATSTTQFSGEDAPWIGTSARA